MDNKAAQPMSPDNLPDISLLADLPTGMVIYDASGHPLFRNHKADEIVQLLSAAQEAFADNNKPFLCDDKGLIINEQQIPLLGYAKSKKSNRFQFAIRHPQHEKWLWYQAETHSSHFKQQLFHIITLRELDSSVESGSLLEEFQERLVLATAGAGIGTWEINCDYTTLKWDDTMFRLYGMDTPSQIKSGITVQRWNKAVHPDDLGDCLHMINHCRDSGEDCKMDFRILWPDHSLRYLRAHCSTDKNAQGKVTRILGTNWDITEQKIAEQKLKESEQRWQFALEGALQGVWDWHVPDGKAIFSKRWKSMLGYEEDEINNNFSEWERLVHPDDLESAKQRAMDLVNRKHGEYNNEFRMIHKDGHPVWILSRGKVVEHDKQGKPLRIIGTHSDISELKQTQLRLDHLAHHDVLTGLPNRLKFNILLEQAIIRAERSKTKLGVLFFDLDNFKQVNDNIGHNIGDELLKRVANRVSKIIRRQDSLSRIGGDEFILLMEDAKSRNTCQQMAKKIINSFHSRFKIGEHLLKVTPSIGIAIFPAHGSNNHQLVKNADDAMYHAKRAGGNDFRFYR